MHTAVYPRIFFHELFVSLSPVCHYSIETRSNPPLIVYISFLQTARWALSVTLAMGLCSGLTTCIKGARQAFSLLTHLAVAHSPSKRRTLFFRSPFHMQAFAGISRVSPIAAGGLYCLTLAICPPAIKPSGTSPWWTPGEPRAAGGRM